MMVNGEWTDKWYEPDQDGKFVRPKTVFRGSISDQPGAEFPAEAGRYHLYVSYACPWAHRTLIVRALKGLDAAISVTVVDPLMGADGWAFSDHRGSSPDPLLGAAYLREVYAHARPDYTGRVTVPVLWDKKAGTVVNNESREIIRMLDHQLNAVAGPSPLGRPGSQVDLAPPQLIDRVDHWISRIYEPINNGVYRSGFATTQAAYAEAVTELFGALDEVEAVLSDQRFLCGEQLTEADVCLFTTLLRFDPVYHGHFKCNLRRIADYPALSGFLRDVYQTPGVADTCDLDHIKRHYYWSHESINPTRIVPLGPELSLGTPHGRARLGGRA